MMPRVLVIVAAFILVLSAVAPLSAAAEFEPGIMLITTEELKSALDNREDLTLINTLSPIEVRDKSIPGSVAMPYEFLRDGKISLPADKNRKLIFYCLGPK